MVCMHVVRSKSCQTTLLAHCLVPERWNLQTQIDDDSVYDKDNISMGGFCSSPMLQKRAAVPPVLRYTAISYVRVIRDICSSAECSSINFP